MMENLHTWLDKKKSTGLNKSHKITSDIFKFLKDIFFPNAIGVRI